MRVSLCPWVAYIQVWGAMMSEKTTVRSYTGNWGCLVLFAFLGVVAGLVTWGLGYTLQTAALVAAGVAGSLYALALSFALGFMLLAAVLTLIGVALTARAEKVKAQRVRDAMRQVRGFEDM